MCSLLVTKVCPSLRSVHTSVHINVHICEQICPFMTPTSSRFTSTNLQLTSTNWRVFTALWTSAGLRPDSSSSSLQTRQFGGLKGFVPQPFRPHSMWRTVVLLGCSTGFQPVEHPPNTPVWGGGSPLPDPPPTSCPNVPLSSHAREHAGGKPPEPPSRESTTGIRSSSPPLLPAISLQFWQNRTVVLPKLPTSHPCLVPRQVWSVVSLVSMLFCTVRSLFVPICPSSGLILRPSDVHMGPNKLRTAGRRPGPGGPPRASPGSCGAISSYLGWKWGNSWESW